MAWMIGCRVVAVAIPGTGQFAAMFGPQFGPDMGMAVHVSAMGSRMKPSGKLAPNKNDR